MDELTKYVVARVCVHKYAALRRTPSIRKFPLCRYKYTISVENTIVEQKKYYLVTTQASFTSVR